MNYIQWFDDITIKDIPSVGGKNASLGQMIATLKKQGIRVPSGFAVTAQAYWYYLEHNNLLEALKQCLEPLKKDRESLSALRQAGQCARQAILSGSWPQDLADEIVQAYQELSKKYDQTGCDVAVRSSATAEDLPTASFAGQQETYLNIRGKEELLENCKKSLASLFTNRAIAYRVEKGFDHFKVALSIGVQKMVRSDLASAGVAFSLDTETGFKDVVVINSSYGLGESVVKGTVVPDEFVVYKKTLEEGFAPIIRKYCGEKSTKLIYSDDPEKPVRKVDVEQAERDSFSLSDDEILMIARSTIAIEKEYTADRGTWSPMDVEWAKDGLDGQIYFVQARPETVHAPSQQTVAKQYTLEEKNEKKLAELLLGTGQSIGQQIVSGVVRVVNDISEIDQVKEGDILVTDMTEPDWVPVMKRTSGIITNRGGRTCHAAIVSRELGIAAIVGVAKATSELKSGQEITLDCSRGSIGYIYEGRLPFVEQDIVLDSIPKIDTEIMMNIGDPDSAFALSRLPVTGVGLARLEFIISNLIKIHPMALIHPDRIKDPEVAARISEIIRAYPDGPSFFTEKLAQGIGMIASAFYPKKVLVRLSDFKSNEYRELLGGVYFEPEEENPMLGLRGASRYYNERYRDAFALECAALRMARETMGLTNIAILVPFVRTVEEAERVLKEMAAHGLERGKSDLRIEMMTEIPSNVLLAEEFSRLFDGFSIGSNDLTQLTLAVDRDSSLVAHVFDERNPAVKELMAMAIKASHRNDKTIGICGQAPSDYPEIAEFLLNEKIDSISLNPDSIIPFFVKYTG